MEPIDLTFRNDAMIYCNELPFGVISPYHYLNIETMLINSPYSGEKIYGWGKRKCRNVKFSKTTQFLMHCSL